MMNNNWDENFFTRKCVRLAVASVCMESLVSDFSVMDTQILPLSSSPILPIFVMDGNGIPSAIHHHVMN